VYNLTSEQRKIQFGQAPNSKFPGRNGSCKVYPQSRLQIQWHETAHRTRSTGGEVRSRNTDLALGTGRGTSGSRSAGRPRKPTKRSKVTCETWRTSVGPPICIPAPAAPSSSGAASRTAVPLLLQSMSDLRSAPATISTTDTPPLAAVAGSISGDETVSSSISSSSPSNSSSSSSS